MIIGALVVTAAYLLINLGYLFLLPINQIAASESMAADAIKTIFPFGGNLIAAIIAITIFFVVNTLIEKPKQAWASLLFMSIGTALFFFFKKKRNCPGSPLADIPSHPFLFIPCSRYLTRR